MVRLKVWKIPGIIWDSYGVLCQTRVVLSHERLFQIRVWCAKSEWAVPALDHRKKKLRSVNFSKFIIKIKMKIGHFLDNFSKVKIVFKIRIDVQIKIWCSKSVQVVRNQDKVFEIRKGYSSTWAKILVRLKVCKFIMKYKIKMKVGHF